MTKNVTTLREPETVVVSEHKVSCSGGGGANGHPKVFMEMGPTDDVTCK